MSNYKQVIIKGITQKGKNRVREHGSAWQILHSDGDKHLLEALNTGYLKWGFAPDFAEVIYD